MARFNAFSSAIASGVAFVLALSLALPASAQTAPAPQAAPSAQDRAAEMRAAWEAAEKASTSGPAQVKLRDQGSLALPDGYVFVPAAEGARVLRAFGNRTDASLVGIVVGTGPDDAWLAVLRFIKEGYIRDDDAKDWNADDLLKNLKAGNDEVNKERAERGFPQIEILGWVEKPAYDPQMHRLVWSLSSKPKDEPADARKGVNYNTYALGREGYFSLNLLTTLDRIEAEKPVARTLLASLAYDAGKRYQDFNASTDRVAEYGLAALVGVAAAKKLGLFALVAAFAAKFAKVGLLALAGIGAVLAKLFRRGPKPTAEGGA